MAAVFQDNPNTLEADKQELIVKNNSTKRKKRTKGRAAKIRNRLRDPFNKQKVKQLKGEIEILKTDKIRCVQALRVLLAVNVDTSPIHVGTLQIDCKNVIEKDTSNIEESLEYLTNEAVHLVDTLTSDNENLTAEIKKLQISSARCEEKLDETKDILSNFQYFISERDEQYYQYMEDMVMLLADIQNDKPDDKVCVDGVDDIRIGNIQEEEYECLPVYAKHLVLRLVNRCGHCGLRALEQTLNASASLDKEDKSNDSGNTSDKPLTKATCTKLLLDWINTSASHDGKTLFSLIQERHKLSTCCSTISQAEYKGKSVNVERPLSCCSEDSFRRNIIAKEPFDKECYFSNTSLEKERLQLVNRYADVVHV